MSTYKRFERHATEDEGAPEEQGQAAEKVGYQHTASMQELLNRLNISLVLTGYQSGRIMAVSPGKERLNLHMRALRKPTGIAWSPKQLGVCSKYEVMVYQGIDGRKFGHERLQNRDAVFVPKLSFFTGHIDAHEAAFSGGELLVVSSSFSCLAAMSPDHSFIPRWRPSFVTALVPEDRCHLNGLACDGTGPRFLTAVAETDTAHGWRACKHDGGVILRYPDSRIVARGFSMPHSPRLYRNALWVLDSGRGEFVRVDPLSGQKRTVCALPGFLRGLAFYGDVAFVGLSKARESRVFGELEVENRFGALHCGVQCIDITSGSVIGALEFQSGVHELFEVIVLPATRSPFFVGFSDELINEIVILPS